MGHGIGMTADEREELIMIMALNCPPILFDYTTFADGSLGLTVPYGDGEDEWITLFDFDWCNPSTGAQADLYVQCHFYAYQKAGLIYDPHG
jgi:hypothetical protein